MIKLSHSQPTYCQLSAVSALSRPKEHQRLHSQWRNVAFTINPHSGSTFHRLMSDWDVAENWFPEEERTPGSGSLCCCDARHRTGIPEPLFPICRSLVSCRNVRAVADNDNGKDCPLLNLPRRHQRFRHGSFCKKSLRIRPMSTDNRIRRIPHDFPRHHRCPLPQQATTLHPKTMTTPRARSTSISSKRHVRCWTLLWVV